MAPLTLTVVVPFHRNLTQLAQCLAAIRHGSPAAELIVAADGALQDCHDLARAHGARVIDIPAPPRGPAAARNRAAAEATGDVLVFVDTDVVAAPDAIGILQRYLETHPEAAGVFGAYDEQPPEPNFSSRYRNLSHSYIHQQAQEKAFTFWAGLGAVRTAAFRAVGGFDERFRRPSIEDIELGYRLSAAGYAMRVEPAARGRHLKRWTLLGGALSDIRDRGVPWAQLILRSGTVANDLNTTTSLRLSLVLSYLLLAAVVATPFIPAIGFVALAALAGIIGLNRRYYAWFARKEGLGFAVRVVGVHILHHLCNGVSLIAGLILTTASRLGLQLPGALPATPWTGPATGAAHVVALVIAVMAAWPPAPAQAQSLGDAWAIDGAVLIDGTGAPPIAGSRIVGRGDRIVCAGPAADCAMPEHATVIDAAGKWVIPGLIDTHVHLEWEPAGKARRDQLVRFALGITTTRDASTKGQLDATLAARARAVTPEDPEPRLVVSGLVAPKDEERDHPDIVAAFVRQLVDRGVDAIKIKVETVKQELSPASLQAMAREAHAAGLPVFGHTWGPNGSFLSAALDAGIDGVSHMYTFSEFALRKDDPARPPMPEGLAFWVWTEEAWNYQDEARLRQATDRLLRQHVWLEPLLVTERHFTLPYPYPDDVAYLGGVASLEQLVRAALPVGDSGWRKRQQRAARLDVVYRKMCDQVREFHARGGMVVTGADESPAGAALLEEVSLLTGCGFTPVEAIHAATQASARALQVKDTGSVEAGKRADLVLLDADPLADLANLRQVHRVIKGGYVHDPAALVAPLVSHYTEERRQTWTDRATGTGTALVAVALLAGGIRRRRRQRAE